MRMLIRLVLPVLVACNGKPLESGNLHYDSLGVETGAVDADGDGYLEHEDCDDEDPTVYPGAEELCDGEDNDCDGGVDEGLSSAPYYMDRDGDGYGSGEPAGEDCGAPDGYSMEDGDCDDQDASVFPGAEETPCDRVDGDCDGVGNEAYQAAVEGVEYEDLQAAIDAAPYDGTVYVCPGAHQASLVIEPAQRLTLASWSASAEDTVLSGDGIDRILEVGEHVQLAIHGLGFRDGLADWKDEYLVACGGSIAGLNVDLEVVGCHFDSSHAEDAGGAICAAWNGDAGNVSTISLQDVVFDGNYAQASGGALAAFSGEDAEAVVSVVDSGFTGNETMGNGGAVYLQSSDTDRLTASIEDSTFTNNTTRLGGDGGALYWKGSPDETLSINDTTFASNIAGHWGLLRLKTPWSDGTAALQLSRSELLQRIIALIPPLRKNESLYHGVFAPNHAWRSEIVPAPPVDATPEHLRIRLTKEPALGPQPAWLAWAALMWRIFQEDRISCPHCGAPMRLRTVALPPATMRVVKGLEQAAARAPPGEQSESAREPLAVGA